MKRISVILVVFMLMLVGCSSGNEEAKKVIGVIQWADHPALNDSLTGMQEALKEAGVEGEFEVVIKNAQGEAANGQLIAQQFVADNVDVIYAIATPAAQSAMTAVGTKDTPIVFSAVTDPVSAGLVADATKPDANVTGVSDLPPLEKQVELMKEILPELKTVGVLFNTGEINSANQIEDLKKIATTKGVTIVEKGVTAANEISLAAQQLAAAVDVMFIINDNMIAAATSLVTERSMAAGKPVFMAEAGQFDQGVFATESISYFNLGKQAGDMIKAIVLDGKKIAEIPVETSQETELIVSKTIADKLGIVLPTSVLERATIK